MPTSANLLHVSVDPFPDGSDGDVRQLLLATTADRRLHVLAVEETFTLLKSLSHLQDSPILSCVLFGKINVTTITSGMSGQVILYDHQEDKVLDERRDHRKYVVKVEVWEDGEGAWVATAGWDGKVFLYRIGGEIGGLRLGPPVAAITLVTDPETVNFVEHPDYESPVLLVTRRDSTSLHYYSLPSPEEPSTSTQSVAPVAPAEPAELEHLGSQNLAPHSNAWIAFSPSSIAISPIDPTLVAVATSAVPHMKLIIVRLLLPQVGSSSVAPTAPTTQAGQTRANLAVQDREDAAIQIHVSTMAPQTPYSTPMVVWRPDGSGVWVNGDDGVLRGLEAKTGKVVSTLKGGHEVGSKIRSVWCGMVGREEWVVSGGFDRRLVVWKPDEATE